MLPRSADAFPFDAVRDLLGVVRALWGAAKAGGAGRAELERIAAVGKELREALALAVSTRPGTIGHTAAWRRAEDATLRVGDLVNALAPAEPVVVAARARVVGARAALRKKQPER